MRRYLPSSRTRSNTRDTNAIRDQFLRELNQQATQLLTQFTSQFSQDLQAQVTQVTQAMQTIGGVNVATAAAGSAGDGGDDASSQTLTDYLANNINPLDQLAATGVRYLLTRPTTSTQTIETSRSIQSASQFRVSAAQAAAQAQEALSQGNKNL